MKDKSVICKTEKQYNKKWKTETFICWKKVYPINGGKKKPVYLSKNHVTKRKAE